MTLERTKTGWSVQLRYGKSRRKRFGMPRFEADAARDEEKARQRQDKLEQLASILALAEHLDAEKMLALVAGMVSDRDFAGAERAARDAASGKLPAPVPVGPRTFRDVAELWLSGELRRRYPEAVKGKAEHSTNQSRGILRAIYPHLDKPVSEITKADVLAAKANATPPGVSQATRAHYARHIRIVMSLAVDPLELIDRSPVPPKFVPSYGVRKALGFLYPDEDAQLLGQIDDVVPYGYRWYYGFLIRNGLRPSEGLRLTYGDLDLQRGILTLDKNKTKTPRAWKMADDVVRQLRIEWARSAQDQEALVFPDVDHDDLAERFREHLWASGVRRRELHAKTDERRPLRVHDLRGSFVTIALAHGANEDWVMRRTGHTTSTMLAKYRRQVEHAREIELGWYQDLDKCLRGQAALTSETLPAHISGVAREVARRVKTQVDLPGFQTWTWSYETAATVTPEPNMARIAQDVTTTSRDDLAEMPEVARAGHPLARAETTPAVRTESLDSPVEQALAAGLQAALKAEQWELAKTIVQELGERRRARTAPSVPSLADARRKKDEGGK